MSPWPKSLSQKLAKHVRKVCLPGLSSFLKVGMDAITVSRLVRVDCFAVDCSAVDVQAVSKPLDGSTVLEKGKANEGGRRWRLLETEEKRRSKEVKVKDGERQSKN